MEHLLLVHGLETSELIHQYSKERLMAQKDPETPSLGILTIRLQFVEDILRVEIMNARNIRPMDSNASTHKILLDSVFIMLPSKEGGRFMCSSCYQERREEGSFVHHDTKQGERKIHLFIMLPSEALGRFICSSCYQARRKGGREGGSYVHYATKRGGREVHLFIMLPSEEGGHLTLEQLQMKDAMVQFVIKDQDFLGMRNEFIGETFISFSDIPKTEMTVGLEQMEQIHLKLSRPASLGSETIRALDHRQGDKLARDFIKKEKSKMIYKDYPK
ncbi:unnamed protein product [Timema podura]|uniref:Uncharacterized protein n=1 Tax=Timema podura TaxID=61482 RepID=A0ABN7NNA3_TIMPD|nr:unnamed protein product [Timema podura]